MSCVTLERRCVVWGGIDGTGFTEDFCEGRGECSAVFFLFVIVAEDSDKFAKHASLVQLTSVFREITSTSSAGTIYPSWKAYQFKCNEFRRWTDG